MDTFDDDTETRRSLCLYKTTVFRLGVWDRPTGTDLRGDRLRERKVATPVLLVAAGRLDTPPNRYQGHISVVSQIRMFQGSFPRAYVLPTPTRDTNRVPVRLFTTQGPPYRDGPIVPRLYRHDTGRDLRRGTKYVVQSDLSRSCRNFDSGNTKSSFIHKPEKGTKDCVSRILGTLNDRTSKTTLLKISLFSPSLSKSYSLT